MNAQPNAGANLIGKDELRDIAGDLDDENIVDILGLRPSLTNATGFRRGAYGNG